MSIAKAIMATDPAERQWYEDQVTVNLYARKLLAGNSKVYVIEDPASGGITGITADRLIDGGIDIVRAECESAGYRFIEGPKLFTARDNPRPFKRAK